MISLVLIKLVNIQDGCLHNNLGNFYLSVGLNSINFVIHSIITLIDLCTVGSKSLRP